MTKPTKTCVDCAALPENERPRVPRPTDEAPRAPRCATHRRKRKDLVRIGAREAYQIRTYGLSPREHTALLVFQGHRCAICRRATGATKALATDHDHACCPGRVSCGGCVRGKLCGPCNEIVIGRYSVEALRRAIEYLRDPPMARLRRLAATAEETEVG